jgi:hypothetical protein
MSALRAQRTGLIVTEREWTGVGFFTTFAVARSAVVAPVDRLRFGNVEARLRGVEPWPPEAELLSLAPG